MESRIVAILRLACEEIQKLQTQSTGSAKQTASLLARALIISANEIEYIAQHNQEEINEYQASFPDFALGASVSPQERLYTLRKRLAEALREKALEAHQQKPAEDLLAKCITRDIGRYNQEYKKQIDQRALRFR